MMYHPRKEQIFFAPQPGLPLGKRLQQTQTCPVMTAFAMHTRQHLPCTQDSRMYTLYISSHAQAACAAVRGYRQRPPLPAPQKTMQCERCYLQPQHTCKTPFNTRATASYPPLQNTLRPSTSCMQSRKAFHNSRTTRSFTSPTL